MVKLYTIVMKNDKTLVTTNRVKIYKNEFGIDTIRFLVPKFYVESKNKIDISKLIVIAKYQLPNNSYVSKQLELQDELYKDMLDYRLDIGHDITKMDGEIKIRLLFFDSYIDGSEDYAEKAIRTGYTYININALDKIPDAPEPPCIESGILWKEI